VRGLQCRDCSSCNLGSNSLLQPLFFLEFCFKISCSVEDFKRRYFENDNSHLIMT
jgi:hypothetical protein